MGAFTGLYDDEVVVKIPPTSPSRRDYQLRSVSPSPSRPQSPWRPRGEVSSHGSQEIDTFRMYDSYPPAARSSYYSGPLPSAPQGSSSFYSGPLPSAPQGVDRSYYSGPLPSIDPPSHGSGFSTTGSNGESFDFEFATWAKSYHRQNDSDSVPRSPDSDDEPSSFYLSNPAESRALANAEFAERAGRMPPRNCVSGELGVSEAIAKQKSEATRGYKSGEIPGLQICADGIYSSSSPSPAIEAPDRAGPTAAWDALMKDAKKDMKDDGDSDMVAIPFKWEEVSCQPRDSVPKKPNSRTSSTSTKPNSRASSVSQKPNSRTSSGSQKPNSRTSSVSQKPNSRTSSTTAVTLPKPNSRASSISQKPAPRAPLPSAAAPSKKPTWNMSTTPESKSSTTKKSLKAEFSFGGSHKLAELPLAFQKPENFREEPQARNCDVVAPPALKPLRTKTAKQQQQQQVVDCAPKSPFSVPFKWEEEPGKSKFETEESKPEGSPLQLPPRLAVKQRASTTPTGIRSPTKQQASSKSASKQASQLGWVSEPESTSTYVESSQHSRHGSSGISSSKKFFDKDCFRRCRRLLVNLF